MVEESLIATRKRRANAGTRLKQLLQAEEVAEADEDDVDLLFEEDENDAEFNVGDEDIYGYAAENSDAENEKEITEGGDVSDRNKDETPGSEEEGESGSNAEVEDNDEMFSDSDSGSDSEESDAGERELQKQERAKRREKAKKSRQVPKIKTPAPKAPPKPKKIYSAPKAETLLSELRRSSSRKIAVKNKLDLVEKLKDEETRRKSIRPVAKVIYKEMTQEERLAEAIETEKYNISTLNKYHEQEIDKQKRRRELMMSKRRQLENVVSFKSLARFVSIQEEHELERFYLTRDKLKKKDRRGRKSEKQKKEEEEARKREEEKQNRLKELQRRLEHNQELADGPPNKKHKSDTSSQNHENPGTDLPEKIPLEEEEESIEVLSIEKEGEIPVDGDIKDEVTDEKKPGDSPDEDQKLDDVKTLEDSKLNKEIENPTSIELNQESKGPIGTEPKIEVNDVKMKDAETAVAIKSEESTPVPLDAARKSVTFADDTKQDTPTGEDIKDSSRETTAELEEIVYEGPEQKVGANYITFENMKLKVDDIKTFLFGKDALLGASRRFKDLEPVLRIKKNDEEMESNSNDFAKEIQVPDLEVLDNFPVFGDFNRVRKEKVILEALPDIKIVLKTQSPAGIYLPNGSKKKCVITGKPAMYFDPKTGMPYSSVEAYKVIKHIQEGGFAWIDFPKGGAYVSDRDNTRHAAGVPEGFDE